MGLGRREFVRLMTLALTGAVVDPLSAVAINENYYVNRKLGVMFEKPENWGFINVHDFGKLKDNQILSNLKSDEIEEFWEAVGMPACILTKYHEDRPEYYGLFSPTVQFFVNHKSEFEDIPYETFEEFIEFSRLGINEYLKNFKIIEEKKPYLKDGCKFYEYNATYDFEHFEIDQPLEVRLNVLIVEHNNFYYYINLHDSPAQQQTANSEFRAFKKSLKLI